MKVLLINPAWPAGRSGARRFRRSWPPLDLLISAAWLRQEGHDPVLLDARPGRLGAEDIRRAAGGADLVLFQTSPLDRWQCPDLNWRAIREMTAGLARERLVVAGAHGTLRPELILEETGAAAVIRGEPEASLVVLAAAGGKPSGLAGLSYIDAGRAVHEPERAPVELDDLPGPTYDLLNLDWYAYELLGPRLAVLETSRGCPHHCAFCLKAMYGPGVRFKSLDRVLGEIEEVVGRQGAESVYFMDLEFTLRADRIMELCRELSRMKLKFRWCCQTRVDAVNPDLLSAMKNAGCALVHFGLETGSARLLEAVGKKAAPGGAEQALDWCRKIKLATAGFFLLGLPGETRADRRAMAAEARRLNPTFASFHVAAPYPGTALNELVESDDPWPVCLGGREKLDELARDVRRAWLGFYLRPGYALGRLREGGFKDHLRRLRLFREMAS